MKEPAPNRTNADGFKAAPPSRVQGARGQSDRVQAGGGQPGRTGRPGARSIGRRAERPDQGRGTSASPEQQGVTPRLLGGKGSRLPSRPEQGPGQPAQAAQPGVTPRPLDAGGPGSRSRAAGRSAGGSRTSAESNGPADVADRGRAGQRVGDGFDQRRAVRARSARVELPSDVSAQMLDVEVRQQLRSLSKDVAELVARHLVMTGRLLEDDPTQAVLHARAACALAGRVGVVREANGLAAYAAQEWKEALSELRTARRITGQVEHLPVMADCERALGRPGHALGYADDPDAGRLSIAAHAELVIVLAGARQDLGQADAAVLLLQQPAQASTHRGTALRLRYAYADALLSAGRADEALQWFRRTAEIDRDGATDVDERLLALEGVDFQDLQAQSAEPAEMTEPSGS